MGIPVCVNIHRMRSQNQNKGTVATLLITYQIISTFFKFANEISAEQKVFNCMNIIERYAYYCFVKIRVLFHCNYSISIKVVTTCKCHLPEHFRNSVFSLQRVFIDAV
jgi:hypothetical protein